MSKSGKANQAACATGAKSTKPNKMAKMYPPTIPNKIGIKPRKPFKNMLKTIVNPNVIIATAKTRMSYLPFNNVADCAADDDNDKPITMMIGPTTIGGNNFSIQFVPIKATMAATIK